MNDLQKARADWLDALTRVNTLERENSDLRQRNYELQMKLMAAEFRATTAEELGKIALKCAMGV